MENPKRMAVKRRFERAPAAVCGDRHNLRVFGFDNLPAEIALNMPGFGMPAGPHRPLPAVALTHMVNVNFVVARGALHAEAGRLHRGA